MMKIFPSVFQIKKISRKILSDKRLLRFNEYLASDHELNIYDVEFCLDYLF